MKRFFDLIITVPLLICISPIMLIIGGIVRNKIGSPVIFKQQRPGLYGKPFYLYKFRSMTNDRYSNGQLLPDKLRITRFGILLRKFSLDELPQLINVIKGDLSLVGPRPLLMEYLPLYTEEQAKRHNVRPGITGWAQINGRNAITWEEKFKHDLWYVNNHTIMLDTKILLITVWKVIKSHGITQQNHPTVESFKGNKSTIKEGHG
ncbi:sugar transferase [Bacillus sp. JJ1521]|uniref:sugar transferase n=1 Tax=Bacillus sp. JJ1521 TaxID=3122957 RepID=UPI003000CE04